MNYLRYFNQDTGYSFDESYIYNPRKTMKVLKWWNSYANGHRLLHFSIVGFLVAAICIGMLVGGLIFLLFLALSNIHPIFILIGGFSANFIGLSLAWDFWKFSLNSLSEDFSKDIFCVEYPELVSIEDGQIMDLQKSMKNIFFKLYDYQSSHKDCKELYYPFKLKCINVAEILEIYKEEYSSDMKMRNNIVCTIENLISSMTMKFEKVQNKNKTEISKRLEKIRND